MGLLFALDVSGDLHPRWVCDGSLTCFDCYCVRKTYESFCVSCTTLTGLVIIHCLGFRNSLGLSNVSAGI